MRGRPLTAPELRAERAGSPRRPRAHRPLPVRRRPRPHGRTPAALPRQCGAAGGGGDGDEEAHQPGVAEPGPRRGERRRGTAALLPAPSRFRPGSGRRGRGGSAESGSQWWRRSRAGPGGAFGPRCAPFRGASKLAAGRGLRRALLPARLLLLSVFPFRDPRARCSVRNLRARSRRSEFRLQLQLGVPPLRWRRGFDLISLLVFSLC